MFIAVSAPYNKLLPPQDHVYELNFQGYYVNTWEASRYCGMNIEDFITKMTFEYNAEKYLGRGDYVFKNQKDAEQFADWLNSYMVMNALTTR